MKKPESFIQWKNTDAFIEITCKCGNTGVVTGTHVYNVKCNSCGTVYKLATYIELEETNEDECGTIINIEHFFEDEPN